MKLPLSSTSIQRRSWRRPPSSTFHSSTAKPAQDLMGYTQSSLSRMPECLSAKAGTIEGGAGRAGVAGGVSGASWPRRLVWVPGLQLGGLDAGTHPAFRQVYAEDIAVAQKPDHASGGGFGGEERDLDASGPARRKPVRENDLGESGVVKSFPEQFKLDNPGTAAWPTS